MPNRLTTIYFDQKDPDRRNRQSRDLYHTMTRLFPDHDYWTYHLSGRTVFTVEPDLTERQWLLLQLALPELWHA